MSAREAEEQHLIGVLGKLHEGDLEGGYRVLADDLHDLGYQVSERRHEMAQDIAAYRKAKAADDGSRASLSTLRYHPVPPRAKIFSEDGRWVVSLEGSPFVS